MRLRYELRAPSTDPDVPGGVMMFASSLFSAAKWCHETLGATAVDRLTGTTHDRTTLPAPPARTIKES